MQLSPMTVLSVLIMVGFGVVWHFGYSWATDNIFFLCFLLAGNNGKFGEEILYM